MPIATLRYNLPEETEEFETAMRANSMAIAIDTIGNEIFRPARKHGYSNPKLVELLEKCGDPGYELIGALEERYYEILREYNALGRD